MTEKELEIRKGETGHVDLWYPDISDHHGKETSVRVCLMHVRASDDIIIHYDGERDGWVISMDRTIRHETHSECTGVVDEMAFISAWANEKPKDPKPKTLAERIWQQFSMFEGDEGGYTGVVRQALAEAVEALDACQRASWLSTIPRKRSQKGLENVLDILRLDKSRDIPKP